MLFLKQLVKLLVLSSADLLHRTSHTKTFLLRAIFYLSIQCLPKVLSLHCNVPMPMFLSPVTASATPVHLFKKLPDISEYDEDRDKLNA